MDNEFVEKLKCGEIQEWRRLYGQLQPKLFGYVVKRVKTTKDAEEICQDVWLSLADALPLFRQDSSIWTFVVGIAKHEMADYWRKKYAKRIIRAVPLIGSWYERRLYSAHETQKDLYRAVEVVYGMLKPSQKQLLVWKYEEKLRVEEIARRLEVSVKAAESKLFRARVAFQELYVEVYGQPEFAVVK